MKVTYQWNQQGGGCDECRLIRVALVRIGDNPHKKNANTVWLCMDCLKAAVEILAPELERLTK